MSWHYHDEGLAFLFAYVVSDYQRADDEDLHDPVDFFLLVYF